MSRTSESSVPSRTDELRCEGCDKCLAKDGAIQCPKCKKLTSYNRDSRLRTAMMLTSLVIAREISGDAKLVKITVVPGPHHAGYVQYAPPTEVFATVAQMKGQLRSLLAGVAAEAEFDVSSTGSSSIMEQAIELARKIVLYDQVQIPVTGENGHSRIINEKAYALLEATMEEAKAIIKANRQTIETLATLLADAGELTPSAVAGVLKG